MTDTEQIHEQASRAFMRAAERTSTLYELSDIYTHLVDLLEDPESDPQLLEQELNGIAGDIKQKAENIAGLIFELEGWAKIRKVEIDRLKARAEQNQAKADWLRDYVLRTMQALDIERIDTARFTLRVKLNPPHVEVLESMLIPTRFLRHIPEQWEPNKKAINDHYKATREVVPGVEIVRTEKLDIR